MQPAESDGEQLKDILRYCEKVQFACNRFGNSWASFKEDTIFQDCCSFYLIQIGEAVHRLSDEFKEKVPWIEWKRIYGMRCHLVHGYGQFDCEIAWDAINNCIPPLAEFCRERVM